MIYPFESNHRTSFVPLNGATGEVVVVRVLRNLET